MTTLHKTITLGVEVELTRYAPGEPDEHYPGWASPSDSEVRVTLSDADTGAKVLDITDYIDSGVLTEWAEDLEGMV